MIGHLKDCQKTTLIGSLPDIINSNNETIRQQFDYIFDSSRNRLTKSVYAPTGSVKSHFGEFVNLSCEYITIKNIESFEATIKTSVDDYFNQIFDSSNTSSGINLDHNLLKAASRFEDLTLVGTGKAHDAGAIIYDANNSVKDILNSQISKTTNIVNKVIDISNNYWAQIENTSLCLNNFIISTSNNIDNINSSITSIKSSIVNVRNTISNLDASIVTINNVITDNINVSIAALDTSIVSNQNSILVLNRTVANISSRVTEIENVKQEAIAAKNSAIDAANDADNAARVAQSAAEEVSTITTKLSHYNIVDLVILSDQNGRQVFITDDAKEPLEGARNILTHKNREIISNTNTQFIILKKQRAIQTKIIDSFLDPISEYTFEFAYEIDPDKSLAEYPNTIYFILYNNDNDPADEWSWNLARSSGQDRTHLSESLFFDNEICCQNERLHVGTGTDTDQQAVLSMSNDNIEDIEAFLAGPLYNQYFILSNIPTGVIQLKIRLLPYYYDENNNSNYKYVISKKLFVLSSTTHNPTVE